MIVQLFQYILNQNIFQYPYIYNKKHHTNKTLNVNPKNNTPNLQQSSSTKSQNARLFAIFAIYLPIFQIIERIPIQTVISVVLNKLINIYWGVYIYTGNIGDFGGYLQGIVVNDNFLVINFGLIFYYPQLINKGIMGLTISTDILNIIGIVYSAIGITLSVVQCFFFKIHSRTLDYLQWAYLMAVAQALLLTPFADQLEVASGQIQLSSDAITNFYAPMGTYVSTQSFALSFLVILVGFLVLMRFITIPEKVQEKGIIYSRVYRLFKGLIKWFYLPLVFQSIYFLLMQVSSELIPSIVILAVLLIFPIVQLLLYRKFDPETEDPFIKWLQFANYCKAALFALLLSLAIKFQYTTYYHYVDVILIAYAGFFIVQYNFKYQRVGRVFYALGEIIFYFLFSLYAASSPWLNDYYIDLFGLGIIMLLDVIYSIMEVVVVCKQWRNGVNSEIVPEDSKDLKEKDKKNSYEIPDMEDISRDQLNDSHVSGQKKKTNSNKKLGK